MSKGQATRLQDPVGSLEDHNLHLWPTLRRSGRALVLEGPMTGDAFLIYVFAKFKNGLRKAAERTVDDLWRRIGVLIHDFSPQECQNYFCHDGYAST
jgi:hypothetical protein